MTVRLREAAGLFGPASISWRIDRELVVLLGGSCALLMQAAHPAVAAAVAEHSAYRTDPFGRLLRTLSSSFAVAFGSRTEAFATIDRINAIHRSVRGRIPESGEPYSALEHGALLWVHATLVDTALRVYDRWVAPLSEEEQEAYHAEAARAVTLLGIPVEQVPKSLSELRGWMAEMIETDRVRVTPTAREIARTIIQPMPFPPRLVWEAAHLVSFDALPHELRRQYGIRWTPARAGGVDRLAALSRRAVPYLPGIVRFAPQARAAQRRVRRAAGQPVS